MTDFPAAGPLRAALHSIGVRAFGAFAFEITADDPGVAEYLARLYGEFPVVSERDAHCAAITGDQQGDGFLFVDGTQMATDANPGNMIGALVHTLTRRMIDEVDALGLHAGGVRRNGVGVALPAPMEHGKSTLTTGLVRAGFDYLSDEAVLLDWETARNIPFPKPLSLDPGSWSLFPEFEPEADLPDDGYKRTQWQVAPSDIRSDVVGEPGPIHLFVLPKYAEDSATRLVPLARAEGIVELAKNTFKFNQRARRSLEALTAAARTADLYRLEIGDLEPAVALVTELVEHG